MPYGVALLGLTVAVLWVASAIPGPAAGVLVWVAVGCALFAAVHLGAGAALLGKRADGRRALWADLVLLPCLMPLWCWWHLMRVVSPEAPWHEVAPGLRLGRRPHAGELDDDVTVVLDLAAELPAPRALRRRPAYRSFPIVPAGAPSPGRLLGAIGSLADEPGTVLVHGAEGHGRAALVTAALLLVRGAARDPADAAARVQRARPRARMNGVQRRVFGRFHLLWQRRAEKRDAAGATP